jgi:glycosyltransferase involved in cell wall biosynthesis
VGQLARELARSGMSVTMWTARDPALPELADDAGVRIERIAPPRLLAPTVWARLARGGARRFDVILEEVIGGERTPFLAWMLAGRPAIGMWYQDNRPLFRDAYGPNLARVAAVVQSVLLWAYRPRYLIAPSEATRSWLVGQGAASGRVCTHSPQVSIPDGVDLRKPFETRRNRFVTIGKFRRLKRFEEAVEVQAMLSIEVPDSELVVLGMKEDDVYLEELRAEIQRRKLSDRITVITNASDHAKYALLADSKALTIHSPIEGFAWTVPEAGLCGVPVVANRGTPGDTVVDGVNGERLAVGDVAGYASLLARWMTDHEQWNRYSGGARSEASRHLISELPPLVARAFYDAAAHGRAIRGS